MAEKDKSERLIDAVHEATDDVKQCASVDDPSLQKLRSRVADLLQHHRSMIASLPAQSHERNEAEKQHAHARRAFSNAVAAVVQQTNAPYRMMQHYHEGEDRSAREELLSSATQLKEGKDGYSDAEHAASAGLQRARAGLQRELQKNEQRSVAIEKSIKRLHDLQNEYETQSTRVHKGGKLLRRVHSEQTKELVLLTLGLTIFIAVFLRVLIRRIPGLSDALAALLSPLGQQQNAQRI